MQIKTELKEKLSELETTLNGFIEDFKKIPLWDKTRLNFGTIEDHAKAVIYLAKKQLEESNHE